MVTIEVIHIDGEKVYMISKSAKDGVKEYFTPEQKFDRYIGSRGYIKKWSNVVKIVSKIITGEIK